jgi:1,4-dihydroxy-6-naphthoate synthase
MFHAMLNGLVDCEGIEFEAEFADIEQLNLATINHQPNVSKISCAIIDQIRNHYNILLSGAALGFGNGPLIIAREPLSKNELKEKTVAVPGFHTTAYALMCRLFPEIDNYKSYIFHQVLPSVLSGECQVGVLIHEERFSFEKHGAKLVADLGYEWEQKTKLPLPLGAIAVSKLVPTETQFKINRILERSIQYAFAHPMESRQFVREHCRDLSEQVIDNHIKMFVNEYSVNIGADGRCAIKTLNNINPDSAIFIDEQ